MRVGVDGRWVVVKLDRGEPVLSSLQEALAKRGLDSGFVVSGIGALEGVELGWFDPKEGLYIRRRFEGSHELLSLEGSVSLAAEPPLHLHATVAGSDYRAVGGHLFDGRVAVLAEIGIRHFEGLRLTRERNPASGQNELILEPREPGKATK